MYFNVTTARCHNTEIHWFLEVTQSTPWLRNFLRGHKPADHGKDPFGFFLVDQM